MKEVIDLQIDTQNLINELGAISNVVTDINQGVVKLASDTARIFSVIDSLVSQMAAEIKKLNSTATEFVKGITSVLTTISDSINKILEGINKPDLLNIANTALQAYSTIGSQNKSGMPSSPKGYVGKFEKKKTSLPNGMNKENTANNDSSISGIAGGMFAGMGDVSSMLPDEAMLQSLTDMIGKLKESAAAWAAQMGAKIADKAVDLQIIALYVADYVKAFGAMVAQIAASTAAWISNTAAKVASTAAEWAQIAATTAWNALCAVATTVTTAFGAAMAFLTSPIGLVVVAITALIAIVVLLVENWDTVKAAAISVWESIKSAFGTAAAWFNENVVAPLAGFFSGLWDGFKSAAANAWEGVKSVFSAVGGFFKDVFSSAWQKVVSVFSAAGNIFVNIKDAIVSVFKSVVNGIINGLNSIIAVPFKGINGALTLVRNIEILGLQPFRGLQTISVPQIPLLAQGAVLPANRPFMAIVGDQRHGTNIEAPLATIQEAVALVMQDQTAAIMAGFNASVGVQREILQAVLGIQIGDDVIAAANDRYHAKLAIQRGG